MNPAQILEWAIANKVALIQGYLALVGLVSVIVKLTPTVKDDNILKGILKFLGRFGALNKTITPAEQRKVNNK